MESSAVRILIIDDSDLCCSILSIILRSDNYKIVGIAHDAEAGKKLAHEKKPDVIMLDILMPGVSGIDSIKPIKALAPDALILMVSGIDDNDMVVQAIQSGANGYIIKPFNSESVIKTMKDIKDKFIVAKRIPAAQ